MEKLTESKFTQYKISKPHMKQLLGGTATIDVCCYSTDARVGGDTAHVTQTDTGVPITEYWTAGNGKNQC